MNRTLKFENSQKGNKTLYYDKGKKIRVCSHPPPWLMVHSTPPPPVHIMASPLHIKQWFHNTNLQPCTKRWTYNHHNYDFNNHVCVSIT